MKLIVVLSIVAVSVLSCSRVSGDQGTGAAPPHDRTSGILWRPKSISVTIKRDDKFLKVGQYVFLEQKLQKGEPGSWLQKVDIPEDWRVQKAVVENGLVVIRLADGQVFHLGPSNVGTLNFAILDGGDKTDQMLQRLWAEHATK